MPFEQSCTYELIPLYFGQGNLLNHNVSEAGEERKAGNFSMNLGILTGEG